MQRVRFKKREKETIAMVRTISPPALPESNFCGRPRGLDCLQRLDPAAAAPLVLQDHPHHNQDHDCGNSRDHGVELRTPVCDHAAPAAPVGTGIQVRRTGCPGLPGPGDEPQVDARRPHEGVLLARGRAVLHHCIQESLACV